MSRTRKVSLQDAKKIVNLLYPTLAAKSRQILPLLRSTLERDATNGVLNKHAILKNNFGLNDLKPLSMNVDPLLTDKKPLSEALELIPKKSIITPSNLLIFRTRNQLLDETDFTKLIDFETSSFDWSSIDKEQRKFRVIQGRLQSLLPRGNYYLIFKNVDQAAAYLVDTLGKKLNGNNVYLEMVDPQEHSQYISNPLLHESFQINQDNVLSLESPKPRKHFVLVKGIPTFIQKSTLKQMLWDFDLDNRYDSIISLKHDPIAKVGMWLLTFETHLESLRFVRKYNGKHFNNEPHLSKVYASILS